MKLARNHTWAFVLAALWMGALADVSESAERGAQRIVTSFYPMYIATINLTKGIAGVTVTNLTKPQTGCLHDYQMTTEDMTHLSRADIFVVNGAGMESFLDKVVHQLPSLKIVRASDGVELLPGASPGSPNPHVWVSVSLHIRQIRNLAAQLSRVDPSHSIQYERNAKVYISKLEKLRAAMHDGLRDIRSRDIITFHEAFPYFAQEFGLRINAVIEREPGSAPSARDLAETIRVVKKAGVRALFAEPQYPAKAAETIARESGAKIYSLDPVVTGPLREDAYVSIMERNLLELRKALR